MHFKGEDNRKKKGQTSTKLVIGPRMGTLKNVGSMFRTSQVLKRKGKKKENRMLEIFLKNSIKH